MTLPLFAHSVDNFLVHRINLHSNGELCVAILLNDISNLKPITLLHASRSGTPISAALKQYYNLEVHIDKLLYI